MTPRRLVPLGVLARTCLLILLVVPVTLRAIIHNRISFLSLSGDWFSLARLAVAVVGTLDLGKQKTVGQYDHHHQLGVVPVASIWSLGSANMIDTTNAPIDK